MDFLIVLGMWFVVGVIVALPVARLMGEFDE